MSMMALKLVDATAGGNPVGGRIAEWLRPYQYKEVARLFDVKPRTACAWKAGNPPQFRHLTAMVDRWGAAFLEYVFAPVLQETDASVETRLESIERSMAVLRGEIREKNMGTTNDPTPCDCRRPPCPVRAALEYPRPTSVGASAGRPGDAQAPP